jgi:nucleolar protein 53
MQAPDVPHLRTAITLPAVPVPHAGTSYNPLEAAHTELLRAAHEAELRRTREAEALEETKTRILSARHADGEGSMQGMLIDKSGDGPAEQHSQDALEGDESFSPGSGAPAATQTKTAPQRKTKQQRRRAEKLRAEVQDNDLSSLFSSFSFLTYSA